VICAFYKGTEGKNKYGEDPLAEKTEKKKKKEEISS
jgi:uncharacterized membrane protein YhaH (DUF805 family)